MTEVSTQLSVGIVGSGTMGSAIALACINSGLQVCIVDASNEALAAASERIAALLKQQVSKGKIDAMESDRRLKLLTLSAEMDSLSSVDVVIEAVFESLDVKKTVFRQLDKICKPEVILATNTSTLSIDDIASATTRPDSVIGLHFFSPAYIMKLVEIVRGAKTSAQVVAQALDFSHRINKVGIVVGNCFGFVGNRMLYSYGRENQLLMLEGAAPEFIDSVLQEWGMAMGPNAVGDLSGLDVGYRVRRENPALGADPRYYRIADVLVEMGRLGQKTDKGIYLYENGSKNPIVDEAIEAIIEREAQTLGITRRRIGAEEVIKRCIYALIVEALRILEDGITGSADDIDRIWTNGYGFPRSRGGPLAFAGEIGFGAIYQFALEYDAGSEFPYWKPPALLQRLAQENLTLADCGY